MEISFNSAKLAKLCNESKEAQKRLGGDAGKELRSRLDDLAAATCLEDLRKAAGRLEELTGSRKGQLSMRLDEKLRLVFSPDHVPVPVRPDGGLDWTAVSAVLVEEVVDYHG